MHVVTKLPTIEKEVSYIITDGDISLLTRNAKYTIVTLAKYDSLGRIRIVQKIKGTIIPEDTTELRQLLNELLNMIVPSNKYTDIVFLKEAVDGANYYKHTNNLTTVLKVESNENLMTIHTTLNTLQDMSVESPYTDIVQEQLPDNIPLTKPLTVNEVTITNVTHEPPYVIYHFEPQHPQADKAAYQLCSLVPVEQSRYSTEILSARSVGQVRVKYSSLTEPMLTHIKLYETESR